MWNATFVSVLTFLGDDPQLAEPKLSDPVQIVAGDVAIDVGGFRGAAPYFGDLDGDGLRDLIVGQDGPGRVRIYRNLGTIKQPRFEGFEWFQANGEIAEVPGGGLFRPQLADLNGDGRTDVVTASESGLIFCYYRRPTGDFGEAEILKLANGRTLFAGANAGCHVVDWDEDGDNDLIISGRSTAEARTFEIQLVENTGSARSLSLAAGKPLTADDHPIQPQTEVYPFVADWNGDDKNDLLLAFRNGSVSLYENGGEKHTPRMKPSRQLLPPAMPRQLQNPQAADRGSGGCLCVTDWNNDGKTDILIGDAQQNTVPAELGDMAIKLEEARQEAGRILGDYRDMRSLVRRLDPLSQAKQRETVSKRSDLLAQRLKEIRASISVIEEAAQPRSEMHGFVWLIRGTH